MSYTKHHINLLDLINALNLVNLNKAILLDIRTKKEYCEGHLLGAIPISTPLPPLNKREKQTLHDSLYFFLSRENVPKMFPIYVYCKKGIRAKEAKNSLRKLGYQNVVVLGGIEIEPLKTIFSNKNAVCK